MYQIIVLAAGGSTRMGRPKMLLPYRGRTVLETVVEHALGAGADGVVVVLGPETAAMEVILDDMGASVQVNRDPGRGLSSSLALGLEGCPPETTAALFVLGDQPRVGSELMGMLLGEHRRTGCPAVAPAWKGRRANPVLFDRRWFDRLKSVEGDRGGRGLLVEIGEGVHTVPVASPQALADLDTPADYGRLIAGELLTVIRGAGDLATGVAHRLWQAGFGVVMTEVPQPLAVRRTVAFAQAVYDGETGVEGIKARRVADAIGAVVALEQGYVPVLVDPGLETIETLRPEVVVDAIMAKRNLGTHPGLAPVVVALGPGFEAGRDAHAVVETQRGHDLGRVFYRGGAAPNTGIPGEVGGQSVDRLIRAPATGVFNSEAAIGDLAQPGDRVGHVDGEPVTVRIAGVLRGLIQDGLEVSQGMKIGDVDPRAAREHCFTISDKARAIGGGVLEAVLHLRGDQGAPAGPAGTEDGDCGLS